MHDQQLRTDADAVDRAKARESGRAKANLHKAVGYVTRRLKLGARVEQLLRELVDLSYPHPKDPRIWYVEVSNRDLALALGYRKDSSIRRLLAKIEATTEGLVVRRPGGGRGRRAIARSVFYLNAAAWEARRAAEYARQRAEADESGPAGEDLEFVWARSALTPERAGALTPERAGALTPERAGALTIQVKTGIHHHHQNGTRTGDDDDDDGCAVEAVPSQLTPEQSATYRAILKRPDWLPHEPYKPWVDDVEAKMLAVLPPGLTPADVDALVKETYRSRTTLDNPAGFFVKRYRQLAQLRRGQR